MGFEIRLKVVIARVEPLSVLLILSQLCNTSSLLDDAPKPRSVIRRVFMFAHQVNEEVAVRMPPASSEDRGVVPLKKDDQ